MLDGEDHVLGVFHCVNLLVNDIYHVQNRQFAITVDPVSVVTELVIRRGGDLGPIIEEVGVSVT